MTEAEIEAVKDALTTLEDLCEEVRVIRNWENGPYYYVRENLRRVIETHAPNI